MYRIVGNVGSMVHEDQDAQADRGSIARRPPLPYRIAARWLHSSARSLANQPSRQGKREDLTTHRHVLLVSFRRDGRPVPTPVWFACAGDALYVRSEADAGKIKRVRRDSRVLVAPCDARGRLLGPPREARGRVLGSDETLKAEVALAARYGRTRRLVERLFFRDRQFAYLEVRLTSTSCVR
jgi:PPOX class probable F420-dependent enzyme